MTLIKMQEYHVSLDGKSVFLRCPKCLTTRKEPLARANHYCPRCLNPDNEVARRYRLKLKEKHSYADWQAINKALLRNAEVES